MQIPRINPVGLVEHPEGYSVRSRSHSPAIRFLAAILLGSFLAVSVATTVYSLGVYCLTSHAGIPFTFSQ